MSLIRISDDPITYIDPTLIDAITQQTPDTPPIITIGKYPYRDTLHTLPELLAILEAAGRVQLATEVRDTEPPADSTSIAYLDDTLADIRTRLAVIHGTLAATDERIESLTKDVESTNEFARAIARRVTTVSQTLDGRILTTDGRIADLTTDQEAAS